MATKKKPSLLERAKKRISDSADRTMKGARAKYGGARDKAVMDRVDEAVSGKPRGKAKGK